MRDRHSQSNDLKFLKSVEPPGSAAKARFPWLKKRIGVQLTGLSHFTLERNGKTALTVKEVQASVQCKTETALPQNQR